MVQLGERFVQTPRPEPASHLSGIGERTGSAEGRDERDDMHRGGTCSAGSGEATRLRSAQGSGEGGEVSELERKTRLGSAVKVEKEKKGTRDL